MSATPAENKPTLRKHIRRQRQSLDHSQRVLAAHNVLKSARQCRPLWFSSRILSYRPFEGEISPDLITQHFASSRLYLPRILNYRTRSMQIIQASSTQKLNHFGILEPQPIDTPLFANQLDAILVPLVAFDRHGNRMGMGAGFYDRALTALSHQPGTRPLLIGLAHWFQEIPSINAQHWDVPLDAILTDREYIPIAPQLLR